MLDNVRKKKQYLYNVKKKRKKIYLYQVKRELIGLKQTNIYDKKLDLKNKN